MPYKIENQFDIDNRQHARFQQQQQLARQQQQQQQQQQLLNYQIQKEQEIYKNGYNDAIAASLPVLDGWHKYYKDLSTINMTIVEEKFILLTIFASALLMLIKDDSTKLDDAKKIMSEYSAFILKSSNNEWENEKKMDYPKSKNLLEGVFGKDKVSSIITNYKSGGKKNKCNSKK